MLRTRAIQSGTGGLGWLARGVGGLMGMRWMKQPQSLWMVMVMALGVSACGTRNLIYVRTGDIETNREIANATCILTNSRNQRWVIPQTPGQVIVQRGGGEIIVVCKRVGFQDAVVRVDASLSAVTLGSAAILTAAGGGVFAAGGLAGGTLAGTTTTYPRQLNVAMAKGQATNSVTAPPTRQNLREQAKNLSLQRSCLSQIGPYDDYIGPLGQGVEECR